MNARKFSPTKISVALLGACLLAGPVFAEPPRPGAATRPVSRTIDIAGLDLSSPKGAERLYREIVATAERVCAVDKRGRPGVAQSAREREYARQCVEQATNGALRQVAAATGFDVERLAGVKPSERTPFASAR